MDFTRFINSSDIRKHLQDIGYVFNSVEAAWLVWQSRAPLSEKHKAWDYIISHMPDARIDGQSGNLCHSSLHTALDGYMTIERRWLREWSAGDGTETGSVLGNKRAAYRISAFTKYGEWVDVGPVYSRWEMALKYCTERIQEAEHVRYAISKYYLGADTETLLVSFTPEGEALSVYCERFECEDDFFLYSNLFGKMCLSFPTPFKAGDVLCSCNSFGALVPYENAFVFTHMTNNAECAMTSDLCSVEVHGYFLLVSSIARIVRDSIHGYMDLEYYRGDTEGKYRALKDFSDHARGATDEDTLCESYRRVISGDGESAVTYYEATL